MSNAADILPQFLYRIRPTRLEMLSTGPTEWERDIIGQHYVYLKELMEAGTVFMAGRTLTADENTFGIVVLQAASEADARTIMLDDPAIKQGVMHYELFPYGISLWSHTRPDT
ncbi:hypothetical protein BH10PSE17_BH10PSE17_08300 [soil metagenome]